MRILFFCDKKEDSELINGVLKFLGGRYDCVAEAEIALVFPNGGFHEEEIEGDVPLDPYIPELQEQTNGYLRRTVLPRLPTIQGKAS